MQESDSWGSAWPGSEDRLFKSLIVPGERLWFQWVVLQIIPSLSLSLPSPTPTPQQLTVSHFVILKSVPVSKRSNYFYTSKHKQHLQMPIFFFFRLELYYFRFTCILDNNVFVFCDTCLSPVTGLHALPPPLCSNQ